MICAMNIVNLSATDYRAYILCVTLNYIFDFCPSFAHFILYCFYLFAFADRAINVYVHISRFRSLRITRMVSLERFVLTDGFVHASF